jgi:hypothetical protein
LNSFSDEAKQVPKQKANEAFTSAWKELVKRVPDNVWNNVTYTRREYAKRKLMDFKSDWDTLTQYAEVLNIQDDPDFKRSSEIVRTYLQAATEAAEAGTTTASSGGGRRRRATRRRRRTRTRTRTRCRRARRRRGIVPPRPDEAHCDRHVP